MNQHLMERVLKSPRLPSLPAIALDVIKLVQQKDVGIRQIAATIQNDPALAGKILKTANSSFYGQAHSISTITHAQVVIGLNSVKILALGFTLVTNLKHTEDDDFHHFDFWKRSLYSATAARILTKEVGLVQQEEAFLGGLLQDLGMMAMNQTLSEEYAHVLRRSEGEHRKLRKLEREIYDMDHAQIGAELARAWNLPPLLVACIEHHEEPADAPDETLPVVQCVALGNDVADVFMSEACGDALSRYYEHAEVWCNLSQATAEPLLKEIHARTVEMQRLFDLPTGKLGNPDAILAQANEALMQITLQTQQTSTELAEKNRQLAQEAHTDSLTGIANRQRFNDYIIEQFDRVRETGRPLSLLFLDTDQFKKFNDTYGHQLGDHVLIELAGLMSQMVSEPGLVARYGGEEFALILPETDRRDAACKAEQLRQLIASSPVMSQAGEMLTVTSSIGVAVHDGSFFVSSEQLIKAADQAVYAAKAGGRNCVRIFTPRPRTAAS